jgi:hypothetical protein
MQQQPTARSRQTNPEHWQGSADPIGAAEAFLQG